MGRSTEQDRPQTKGRGILKRFKKHERLERQPIAFGWIKATYPQAIEYAGVTNVERGLLIAWAIFGFAMFGWLAWFVASTALESSDSGGRIDVWFGATTAILVGGAVVVPCFIAVFAARIELFTPTDEPILFDRAHRKVYRLFREQAPGWKGLFRPWPLYATSYDWDLLDAEHNAEISVSAAGVSQQHALTFLVRKSADDTTIIDTFNVGQIMALTEHSVPLVWEHIRRFMEEGGPHLPPGESVNTQSPPLGFWQAVRNVLPPGQEPMGAWMADHAYIALFFIALSPLMLPIYLIWGFGNWLSHKTSVIVHWPDAVLRAVGEPLQPGMAIPAPVRPLMAPQFHAAPPTPIASEAMQPVVVPYKRSTHTAPPVEVLRIQHAGGPLALHFTTRGKRGRAVRYVLVDEAHNTRKGDLDSVGAAVVEGVGPGWVTVAYFDDSGEAADA